MEDIQLLRVSKNRRFLVKEDGSPFFWLGDTAWELFHRLGREEVVKYLKNRADNKFNVIQAVALAELDGIREGNYYGKKPLLKNNDGKYDPTLLATEEGEYDYWDHVDYIVDEAAKLGIYIALLPTWGDKYNKKWGKGPDIFTEEKARKYGEWLGNRYRDYINIIWVMGGDRPLDYEKHYRIVRNMAEGIKKGDQGSHLMTFHPVGGYSSSDFVHDQEWLDFNMIQSGHGLERANYKMVTKDYKLSPVKPTLDGEPCYEDHPVGFNTENGYFDAFDVRNDAYWAVFAGAFGHTYGHHSIWSMIKELDNNVNQKAGYFIMDWDQAILRPGAKQMKYLSKLMKSHDFLKRVPDQSLLVSQYEGQNHLQTTRGEDYVFVYNPSGLKVEVKMGKISGDKVKAYWYNPRNGKVQKIGEFDNKGVRSFIPPTAGRGNDWVLVLDDVDSNYNILD